MPGTAGQSIGLPAAGAVGFGTVGLLTTSLSVAAITLIVIGVLLVINRRTVNFALSFVRVHGNDGEMRRKLRPTLRGRRLM